MRPGLFIKLAVMLAPLLAPGMAMAQAGSVQPLDRLLPQIRRSHPGEFYDADGPTPGPGGSQHYHLKWMTPDGRILWLDTDARTGRVLGEAPGRDTFDGPAGGRERDYGPRGNFRPREDYDDRPGDDDWRARGSYDRRYDGRNAGSYPDRRFDGPQYEGPPQGGRQFDGRQGGGRQSGGRRDWSRGRGR